MFNNPMFDYSRRSQLLAQKAEIDRQLNQLNMPPQQQFTPYPQPQQPSFFVRQVGNIEEAKSFPVDVGNMYFFLDTGNGKIYFKQLNQNTGKSDFYIYCVQEQAAGQKQPDVLERISARLDNIERIIGGIYEPISGVAGNAKPAGDNAAADSPANAAAKSANV